MTEPSNQTRTAIMTASPTKIRSLAAPAVLEIHWSEGKVQQLPFRFLRGECRCAGCVNEITGVRTLDLNAIPEDIKPTQIRFSGNYALKVDWSDGHNSGLYSWEHLIQLEPDTPGERKV